MDSTQSKKRGITWHLRKFGKLNPPPSQYTYHTCTHTHTYTAKQCFVARNLRKLWASWRMAWELGYPTHLFIADGDDTTSVCVHSLEALCERSQHDTTLDKVVKLHRLFVAPVKHTGTKVTKLHWPASGTNEWWQWDSCRRYVSVKAKRVWTRERDLFLPRPGRLCCCCNVQSLSSN